MKAVSTRDKNTKVTMSEALLKGLAPDGGLYVPEYFPSIPEDFTLSEGSARAMYYALKPFFLGDELEEDLLSICESAFSFPISFFKEGDEKEVMELYHGPTNAFKDFGARFLSFSMEKLLEKRGEEKTILVATSGDTGGAVASAFWKRKNIRVKVLFPKGRVSKRQRAQLVGWGENIESYEVDGSFDDCQKMTKDAFMDQSISSGLSSSNSINIGRLLPQMAYYVYASFLYQAKYHKEPLIIVPSGNVGNVTGAYWAKKMGAPIKRIVIATNLNKTIPDYLESGDYKPRASIRTLASAMDVGAPSNMERMFDLYKTYEEMKSDVTAYSVSDNEIRETIKETYDDYHYVICPHTATAERVRRDYFSDESTIIISTAHPAKFSDIVEPLIGETVPIPKNLYDILNRKDDSKEIGANYKELF